MSAPKDAPKSEAGWIHWGPAMSESAHLSEPQMRVFVTMMRDCDATTTGEAYPGKSTVIADHCVWLNANAVRALEDMKLVSTILRGGNAPYRVVIPTDRAVVAWFSRNAELRKRA